MNRIGRLIIKARKNIGTEPILAMVECCGGCWTALAYLWSRRDRSRVVINESTHATLDAAVEHLSELTRAYPNGQDVQIIVDDIPAE